MLKKACQTQELEGPDYVLMLGRAATNSPFLLYFFKSWHTFRLTENLQEYDNEFPNIFHTDSPNVHILLFVFPFSHCLYVRDI